MMAALLIAQTMAGCSKSQIAGPTGPTGPVTPDGPSGPPPVTSATMALSPDTGSTYGRSLVTVTIVGEIDWRATGATTTLDGIPIYLGPSWGDHPTTFLTPPHAAGRVDLVVTSPNGVTQTFVGAFTYVEPDTYTLSGVITEMTANGPMPAEGVSVGAYTCDRKSPNCSMSQLRDVVTGRDGAYSFSGVWAGEDTGLYVRKEGFIVDGPAPSVWCEGCDRLITATVDTQVDLQLIHQ